MYFRLGADFSGFSGFGRAWFAAKRLMALIDFATGRARGVAKAEVSFCCFGDVIVDGLA
jgi:hypothetical protein